MNGKSIPTICPFVRMADVLYYPHRVLKPTLAMRRLLDYQLFFLKSGQGRIRLADNVEELKAGSLVLMQPGVAHAYSFARARVYYLHFDLFFHPYRLSTPIIPGGRMGWSAQEAGLAQPALNDILGRELPLSLVVTDAEAVEGLFRDAVEVFIRTPALHQLRLQAVIAELAGRFLDAGVGPRVPSEINLDGRLDRSLLFMKGNLHERVALKDIASAAGLSPSRFSHAFKTRHGCGPIRYFNRIKMEAAEEKIKTSGLKIASIAQEFGYDNPLNFSRDFKRVTGTRPREARSLPVGR